jgi:prepilin-type N-terminal cleavage/methylation domain-containing protein
MRPRTSTDGFTVVELMVVLLIIGILVSIAVTVFPSTRDNVERQACFANERTVEGQWMGYVAGRGRPDPAPADRAALLDLLVPDYVKQEPECPTGGTYAWDDDALSCSVHGHF